MFSQIDTDGDGVLSLEELQNSKAPIHGGGDPRNLTPEQAWPHRPHPHPHLSRTLAPTLA